jgi:parallel beta-helix repeat protein
VNQPSGGGGIDIEDCAPTILNNVVTGNTACNGGGGIYVDFGSALIHGNTISENAQNIMCSGGIGGGGIALGGMGAAQLIANTIYGNSWSSGDGGGISLFAAGNPVIMNNLIYGNLATGVFSLGPDAMGGGIAMVNDSDPLLIQNVIVNNTADYGGGVAFLVPEGSQGPLMVNNTIAGNTSTQGHGSALYASGFDGPTELFNNLLIGVSGATAVDCDATYSGGPPVFQYNDAFTSDDAGFEGLCAGDVGLYGNISADPLLLNLAANDVHLYPSSGAIDVGTNSAPDLPATDFYGNPRIVNGGGSAGPATIDIGADEYQPSMTPMPTPTSTQTPTPTPTPRPTKTPIPTPTPTAVGAPRLTVTPKVLNFGRGTLVNGQSNPKFVKVHNASKKDGPDLSIGSLEPPSAAFKATSLPLEPGAR